MSSEENKEKVISSLLERWPSMANAITQGKDDSADLNEQFNKINDDLTDINSLLSSVNKWEKGAMNLFKVLDGKIRSINAADDSSNEFFHKSITIKLDDIDREIDKINKYYRPFLRLQGQDFPRFFDQWSAAKAIAKRNDYSTDMEKKTNKIDNVVKEIQKSLLWVDEREKAVMDSVMELDKKVRNAVSSDDISITNKLHDIGQEIGKIKMHYQPFLGLLLPKEDSFLVFERWSSVANAIANDHTDLRDEVNRIDNVLNGIRRSLGSVDEWEKSMRNVIDVLDRDFIEIQNTLSITPASGSSNKPHYDSIKKKLQVIARKIGEIKIQSQPFLQLQKISPPTFDENSGPSTIWRGLESEDEIMASSAMADAWSTYDYLEPDLKLRFLCLSIFPEGTVIRKRSLIYWWIGEDFAGGKADEQIEEECFKKLCESGLIEPIYDRHSTSPHSCKLHPWIRWMAIRMAKDTMFFDFDSNGKPRPGPSECLRRACVATTGGRRAEKIDLKSDVSELRSLFNIDVHVIECDEEEFKMLKNVVVLQLGRWIKPLNHHIELFNPTFLDHLGLFKSLRYLGLRGISRISMLPDSIKELSELRVLDLRACHNLEKLPAGIASLKKLTHLDVYECYFLEYIPKGLGSLSELEFLNGFVISNSERHNACKLSELTKLHNLRKLGISFSVDGKKTTAGEMEVLKIIEGLQTLTITWVRKYEMTNVTNISLSLPSKLTKLDLRCFPNVDVSGLLAKPNNLKKLYFRGGRLQNLSGLQKCEVERLRLRSLMNFSMEWEEMKKIFTELKYIEIFKCPVIGTSFLDGVTRSSIRYLINPLGSSENEEKTQEDEDSNPIGEAQENADSKGKTQENEDSNPRGETQENADSKGKTQEIEDSNPIVEAQENADSKGKTQEKEDSNPIGEAQENANSKGKTQEKEDSNPIVEAQKNADSKEKTQEIEDSNLHRE